MIYSKNYIQRVEDFRFNIFDIYLEQKHFDIYYTEKINIKVFIFIISIYFQLMNYNFA